MKTFLLRTVAAICTMSSGAPQINIRGSSAHYYGILMNYCMHKSGGIALKFKVESVTTL